MNSPCIEKREDKSGPWHLHDPIKRDLRQGCEAVSEYDSEIFDSGLMRRIQSGNPRDGLLCLAVALAILTVVLLTGSVTW